MKYKLTNKTKNVAGITVYQIQALKDFGNVKVGDVGGWVENEFNLSQEGNCWISDNAVAIRNSRIQHNAQVYENACITTNAIISRNAKVHGNSQVSGRAQVTDNADIFDYAHVTDNTVVSQNACVFGKATVKRYALVRGNAKVALYQSIQFNGVISDITDISNNLIENIEAQTGLKVVNKELYCYKHVRSDLSSIFDKRFKYKIGEYAIEPRTDDDQTSYTGPGLYVSNAQKFNGQGGEKILLCKVHIDDIVSIQNGDIRCKKLFVIDICDGLVF